MDYSQQTDFLSYQMIDRQSGAIAGIFDYPKDWEAGCNIIWNYQNANSPVSYNAWAINPRKFEMFAFLPMQTFSWTEPDAGMYFKGQNVGGVINHPPMSAEDAAIHWLIPAFCGVKENFKLGAINTEPINRPLDLRAQSAFYHQVSVRVEYSEKGLPVEEEFQFVHLLGQLPPSFGFFGAIQTTVWAIQEVCSFRAEKGKLDESREIFRRIKSSLQINPQWLASIQQSAQSILQNQKQAGDQLIENGWENVRMNQQRMQETAARNQAYIDQQQRRIDAIPTAPPPSFDSNRSQKDSEYSSSDAFIDAVYERQSIYNSENTANEKVSGYDDYIWKDEFGNVRTTNDPNYDPNVGSNINWTQARKKKIGD